MADRKRRLPPPQPKRRQRGEGSVYQRKDGQWVGLLDLGWRDGKRRRKAIYGRTQAEAVRKLGRAKRDLAEHGDLPTAGITVEKWMTYWLDNIAARRLKPSTLSTYRGYVRKWVVPAIGRHRLDRLTPKHIRDMHTTVTDHRSTTTALQVHNIVHRALKDAMRDGRIPRNVAELVDRPKPADNDRGALSLPEAVAVMTASADDRLGSRWHMALLTGARQGECLGLRWSHVDLTAGVVDLAWSLQRVPYRHGCGTQAPDKTWPCERKRAGSCTRRHLDVRKGLEYVRLDGGLCLLRPKTRVSTRVVPIPEPLQQSLKRRREQYLAERDAYTVDHDLVWCRLDGRPIEGGADDDAWREALARCGIGPKELHTARHTTATLLQALGVPEDVRMSIMGHSQAATQRGYAHVDLTLQRAALAQLGERLSLES